MVKYYLDTCIWIDFFENRVGPQDEPFGEWAFHLLSQIIERGDKIVVSDHLLEELRSTFSKESIQSFLNEFADSVESISYTFKQAEEARGVAEECKIPYEDALHVILSRDQTAFLVTRDEDFKKLSHIAVPFRAETLL